MLSKFTLNDVCESLLSIPANIAIFRVAPDDQFIILGMSPSLEALYGVGPGGAIGQEVANFRFDEAVRNRLRANYINCRDSRATVSFEEELTNRDGSRFWTSRTVTPLFDADEQVVALVATVFDITELVSKRRMLIRTLSTTASGFVTLCAWCRKVEEGDSWTPLEEYVKQLPDSDIVLCPNCRAAGS